MHPEQTAIPGFIREFQSESQLLQRVSSDGLLAEEALQIIQCVEQELQSHIRKPSATKQATEQLGVKVEKLAHPHTANQLSTACNSNQEQGTIQRKRQNKMLHKNLLQNDKFKRNVSEVPK